jgi:hypothetical protein
MGEKWPTNFAKSSDFHSTFGLLKNLLQENKSPSNNDNKTEVMNILKGNSLCCTEYGAVKSRTIP